MQAHYDDINNDVDDHYEYDSDDDGHVVDSLLSAVTYFQLVISKGGLSLSLCCLSSGL